MPRSMKRSAYPAVTLVMTVLVGAWLLVRVGRRTIPPGPPNRLAAEASDYLQAGAYQTVPWWPMGSEAFAEARRRDRPIFLLVSSGWSATGRLADATIFTNTDVVDRLRMDFVCIRVDASERREWVSAFLPVSRATLGFEPGFQIWILDPQQRLFDWALRETPDQKIDYAFMVTQLRESKRLWEGLRSDSSTLRPGVEQKADFDVLTKSPESTPDFEQHLLAIRRGANSFGGFPVNRFQVLRPSSWRYLMLLGETELLRATLEPVLFTPIVDWIDGGFFRLADGEDWKLVEFDKLARQNAEMMALLAAAWCRRQDPLYRSLVERTFRCLNEGFRDGGLVRGYRIGDEGPDRRSARNSFAGHFLRGGTTESRFSAAERSWLAENLGLDPITNPLMVPYLPDRATFDKRRTEMDEYLGRLRASKADVAVRYGGARLLDVNAFVAARMFEAGRLLDDPKILAGGDDLYARLGKFRAGVDDVVHSLEAQRTGARSLVDYLAYADAAMQRHLAYGDLRAVEDGTRILRRALEIFTDRESSLPDFGLFEEIQPIPPDVRAPQLCDDTSESASGMAIRVLFQYAAVLRCLPDRTADGKAFFATAVNWTRRLANPAAAMGTRSSGYFCAAWMTTRDRFAIVTGAGSVQTSRRLSAMAPTAFVTPLYGSVTDRLIKPGIYLWTKGTITGPIGIDEAAARLTSLMP
mgnify:CR=1 FL=1